jgi:hypothetical protein
MPEEKKLFETNNIVEAQLLKGRLEAAGINVLMKGESIGGAYPITTDGWGKIRIYVMEEDFEKAKELLEEPGEAGDK